MAKKGLDVVIEVSDDDVAYTALGDLNSGSMSHAGNNIDVSRFGVAYMRRMQGIKDNTFSLSGFRDPADAGQQLVRDAWLNDTELHCKFLEDGVAGVKQEVKVSSFEVSASADGALELSIELEGHDALTPIP